MIKHDFKGTQVSALGLGMMRLPHLDGDPAKVDEKAAMQLVDQAIEGGVNYFDTAWMYHGGTSEEVSGRCLNRHKRDKFLLATKFPGQLPEAANNVSGTFRTQLDRCGTDFFDFYLLHNVYEKNIDVYLDDEKYGIVSFLKKQKSAGKIRHLGFSCHGTVETIKKFLDRYGEDMEFAQIQLNYLDWNLQNAAAKLELLKKYDMPVWVMEPLRGGSLSRMSSENREYLEKLNPEYQVPEWSFRFLQSIPEVKVVLSGMSTSVQLTENMKTFSEYKPLPPAEFDALTALGRRMIDKFGVPCTGCNYCTSKCPRSLDIPFMLAQYNEHRITDGGWMAKMMVESLDEGKRPANCIGCRSCEKMCPQQINIADILKEFAEKLK